MFLATTSDQQFWNKDEKILLLGEWCKIYSQKDIWSKLDYQVLPYHWDDRDKRHSDWLYLQSLHEKYLSELAGRLNKIHGANYSDRYWRILIGPWLFFFIPVFYDAYLSIRTAIDSKLVSNTWLSDQTWTCHLKENTKEFLLCLRNDEDYRHYLYSWIIREHGNVPFETHQTQPVARASKYFSDTEWLKAKLKKLLTSSTSFIPDQWQKKVIVESYLSPMNVVKLQLALRQFPIPFYSEIALPTLPADKELRGELNGLSSNNEFESFLAKILPQQIPKVFLEGYSAMQKISSAKFPKRPELILTGVGLYLNEGFNFWAARHADKVKLIGLQHGGGWGSARFGVIESHDLNTFDRFYSWGESGVKHPIVKPMASPSLSCAKRKIKCNPNGGILWVGISVLPRYFYLMVSGCTTSQILSYPKEQELFASSVSPEVHELLLFRLCPTSSGLEEEERWFKNDPKLKLYRGNKPMIKQLNECRLSIHTYNGTPVLQTLSANYPTILFMNPDHWELSESAKPYFEQLRKVGILYDTPESAASKVNEIYENPLAWWMSAEVQEAKNIFCQEYARTSENWLTEWKNELLNLTSD